MHLIKAIIWLDVIHFIYSDVIEFQSVGDSYVPLLRCVHIQEEHNQIINVQYKKPHYVPVNKSHITEIVYMGQTRWDPFTASLLRI